MKILFLLISMLIGQLHAMEIIEPLKQFKQKLETVAKMLATPKAEVKGDVEKPKLSEFLYYNLDENIFQRSVLQQVNNANCGYYALKDTLYTLQALEGYEQVKELLSLYLKNKDLFNEDYEVWSKAIAQERAPNYKKELEQRKFEALQKGDIKSSRKISGLLDKLEANIPTDWLEGSEIEWLYEHKTPGKPASSLWTIDNIDWMSAAMNYQGLALNPQGLSILENFRNKVDYQCGFLLNYAHEYFEEGTIKAGYGHWIGVVVAKKGSVFTYYITDSLNHDRTKSDAVLALKKIIEKDNIIIIKILSEIQNYLDTINYLKPVALGGKIPDYTNSQEQAIDTVLNNIRNIIQTAQQKAFFNAEEFKHYKQILVTTLNDIVSTGKVPVEFSKLLPTWLLQLQ